VCCAVNGTEEETENSANCLWLITNSKACPNCKSPIQKNEGCNHMKCSKVSSTLLCALLEQVCRCYTYIMLIKSLSNNKYVYLVVPSNKMCNVCRSDFEAVLSCCVAHEVSKYDSMSVHNSDTLLCDFSQCKFDFCWVCLEAWKKHSTATGGYFRCNRYEIVKKVEESHDNLKSEVYIAISFCWH